MTSNQLVIIMLFIQINMENDGNLLQHQKVRIYIIMIGILDIANGKSQMH